MNYDIKKDGITQGLLSSWKDCRERSRLFLEGWTPKVGVSMALTYGTITHAILEKAYRDIASGVLKTVPTSAQVRKYVSMVEKEWERENFKADKKTLEFKEQSCALAEVTLPLYFDFWRKDLKKFRWVGIEKEFKLPFILEDGRKTLLRGKMDGVYYQDKKLWLFETKAKSRISEDSITDVLSLDFQINFYAYCLRLIYGKYPAGVKYNIVRRTGMEAKKGESLSQFTKRYEKDIEKRPEYYFMRYELALTEEEVDDFEIELHGTIKEFYDWYEKKSFNYKNTGQCETKYGNCWALGICTKSRLQNYEKRKIVFRELGGDF